MKKLLFLVLAISLEGVAQEIELDAISVEGDYLPEAPQERIVKKSETLAKEAKGETLGDYLEGENFVDSASYGPAVGRPVVRGMDGYRVGVTSGNVVLNDLSSMSQDHAVGVMPRASEKIELIKGPSSLLYGNYSGGVVRVLGEEHNDKLLKEGYTLKSTSSYGSNGTGSILGATLDVSENNVSFHSNTFYYKAENYRDGDGVEVKDTNTRSQQSHVVLGYQFNQQNLLKIYVDQLNKDYGIPNSTAEATTIEMEQTQFGAVYHAKELFDDTVNLEIDAHNSTYLHSELEGGRADGLFGQDQLNFALIADITLGESLLKSNLEYQENSLQVCHDHSHCQHFSKGERTGIEDGVELQKMIDKFGIPFAHGHPMPNIDESLTKAGLSLSNFVNDEDELTFALRGEFRILQPDSSNMQEEWLVTDAIDSHFYDEIKDSALSASIGFNGYLGESFSYQTSLSYVERLPSSTELFWNGFHHATSSYILGDRNLDNERSFNFDFDTMYIHNEFTTQASVFYYHFLNYIYQDPMADANGTLLSDPFHNSDVWMMRGVGAKVYGAAFVESYSKALKMHTFGASMKLEAIRGTLLEGTNLPRIPTFSSTLTLEHSYKDYKANMNYKYVDKSRFEATNESSTPAYDWVSLLVSYESKYKKLEYTLYAKGENLTDSLAYNHLSFLKASAPLPGRQITVGLDLKF